MMNRVVIPTEIEGVHLRQLSALSAGTYFDAIAANRVHLSQFDDSTAEKYPTLESVQASFSNPVNPDRLRLGIWTPDALAGSINLTPDREGGAEIGYWLDARHTGKGYATVATRALATHARKTFNRVFAEVHPDNKPSARVLERSGFAETGMNEETGRLVFELLGFHQAAKKIARKNATHFERPGFTGHVYVDGQSGEGFNALSIDVKGSHPLKEILKGNTRVYHVVKGTGTFKIDGVVHGANEGDTFVIPAGGTYEYEGNMKLFEVNVSPDGSFGDRKL